MAFRPVNQPGKTGGFRPLNQATSPKQEKKQGVSSSGVSFSGTPLDLAKLPLERIQEVAPLVPDPMKVARASEGLRAEGLEQILQGKQPAQVGESAEKIKSAVEALIGGEKAKTIGDVARKRGANELVSSAIGIVGDVISDPIGTSVIDDITKLLAPKKAATSLTKETVPTLSDVAPKLDTSKPLFDDVTPIKHDKNYEKVIRKIKPGKSSLDFDQELKDIEDQSLSIRNQAENLDPLSSASTKEDLDNQFLKLQDEKKNLIRDKITNELIDYDNKRVRRTNPVLSLASTYVEERGPAGALLGKLMNKASLDGDGYRASYLTKFEPTGNINKLFKKLTPEEKLNFTAAADGFEQPATARVRELIEVWEDNWKTISDQAARKGLSVELPDGSKIPFPKPSTRQLPHFLPDARKIMKDPARIKRMLDYNVKIGRFANIKEAQEVFNAYIDTVNKHVDDSIPVAITDRNEKFFEWLQKKMKLTSKEQAEERFRKFYSGNKKTNRFGQLEFARNIEVPFYEVDPEEIVSRYYTGVGKRFGEIDNFGPNGEIADSLVQGIRNTVDDKGASLAEDADYIQSKIVDPLLGRTHPDKVNFITDGLNTLRNLQVITKLGRAVVFNSTQSKNTAAITGFGRTAKAMTETFGKEGKEFATRAGVLFNDFTDALYGLNPEGITGRIADMVLKGTGFSTVERFNRVTAALAGRRFARDMADEVIKHGVTGKGAKAARLLREMDINPEKLIGRSGLSEADEFAAARSIATRTQFRSRLIDSPVWANNQWGKLANQFKNFIENESKFIRKELWREFVDNKNPAPLMRYVLAAPTAGIAAVKAKDVISDAVTDSINTLTGSKISKRIPAELTKSTLRNAFDAAGNIGALGLYYDILNNIIYDKEDWLLNMVVSASELSAGVGGIVSSFADAFDDESGQLVDLRPVAKNALRSVPVLGPDLQRGLEPEKTTKARFTTAIKDATRAGKGFEDINKILKRAEQSGLRPSEVRQSARQSIKTSDKNKRELRNKANSLMAQGKVLEAIAILTNLSE